MVTRDDGLIQNMATSRKEHIERGDLMAMAMGFMLIVITGVETYAGECWLTIFTKMVFIPNVAQHSIFQLLANALVTLNICSKLLIYLYILCVAENGGKSAGSGSQQNYISSGAAATLFTTRNNTRVIAQRGGLAVLPCAIKWNPAATVIITYNYNFCY